MSRRTLILGSTVVFALIVVVSWTRGLQHYQEKRAEGRAVATGLNAQFLADPRFNKVRVLGYTGRAALPWLEGKFEVVGTVPTRKDFADLVGIVRAMSPPGKLSFKIALTPPAPTPVPAPKPRTR
jgi:hypothetical protein